MQGQNERTLAVMDGIHKDGHIFMQGTYFKDKYFLRYVPSLTTTEDHVNKAWGIIRGLI